MTRAPATSSHAPIAPQSQAEEDAVADLADRVRRADRAALGRAITLIESTRADHQRRAGELLSRLMPWTGRAIRVGVTGVPGVGKSTFIERLGTTLTARGRRVAVLAVDPSSSLSGGSILGDKTRMAALAADRSAFIRPSPSSGTLGGVARRTRETMLACEAAGYDVVLVETVGVGQSETLVAGMTDVFLALMLPGAGDELQGIKRGLLELADVLAVNKADGDNAEPARRAAADLSATVRLMGRADLGWTPPVLACSAATGAGIGEVWAAVEARVEAMRGAGRFEARRREQLAAWFHAMVRDGVLDLLASGPTLRAEASACEAAVLAGSLSPSLAAARVVAKFIEVVKAGDPPPQHREKP